MNNEENVYPNAVDASGRKISVGVLLKDIEYLKWSGRVIQRPSTATTKQTELVWVNVITEGDGKAGEGITAFTYNYVEKYYAITGLPEEEVTKTSIRPASEYMDLLK